MKYLPLKFHVIYIISTLLFSFFGPREYLNYEKIPVAIFIFFYLISVTIGFYLGCNSKLHFISKQTKKDYTFIQVLFKYSLFVSIFFMLTGVIHQYSQGRININLLEIGKNYIDYYQYYNEKKVSTLFTIEFLLLIISAIPKFVTLCLGFFFFSSLRKSYKYFFLLFIFLVVLSQTISNGNQKSLGDIFIIGTIAVMVKMYKYNIGTRKKITKRIVTGAFLLFFIFSYSQYSRLDSREISISDINNHMYDYSSYNTEHPIFTLLGDKIGIGVSAFTTGYLSGGYYGLSKCLTLPFKWTYGIGNSVAASSIVKFLFGIDLYEQTYIYRMEETFGIPGKSAWHTIFPWLASDISFFGIPLLFFLISYYYGKSWREILVYNNPISMLLFSLLSVLFVFVVANNQILHGYNYLFITLFVITIYVIKRKRYNVK